MSESKRSNAGQPSRPIPDLFGGVPLREVELPFASGAIRILVPRDPFELMDQAQGTGEIYWAEIWPSGLALCGALLDGSIAVPSGRHAVLDLGCGTGLASVAVARRLNSGGPVLAVDYDSRALVLTAENARRNGVSDMIDTLTLDWRQPYSRKHRLILAADCLYEPRAAMEVARFIREALDPAPEAQARAIVVDPDRWSARNFRYVAEEEGLDVSRFSRPVPFATGHGPVRGSFSRENDAPPAEAYFYELRLAE